MIAASFTTVAETHATPEPSRPQPFGDETVRVVEATSGWRPIDLAELWRYRDLLVLLVWRDVSARYRQSVLGVGWAIVRPVLSMLIFTVIFGRMAGLPSDGVPYPLFCYAALLPWLFFAECLGRSSQSVVGGGALLTKAYFPRLLLPLSSVVLALADLAVQLVLLLGLMAWYRVGPTAGLLLAPAFLLLGMAAALAVGLWLTALNVKYRDVGHVVPFLLQAWMWLSPVVYPSSLVPEGWRVLYGLNPMAGVIEGFRWAVLGKAAPDWAMLAASAAVVGVLLVSGLFYFRKTEKTFADII